MEAVFGWTNFKIASKLDKEDDVVQRATLLHFAGTRVQRLLTGLPGEKEKCDKLRYLYHVSRE